MPIPILDMAESFDLSAPWLPTRHFELSISTQDEDDLGGAQACKVYLVHKDEWPCADAGKMSEDRIWNIYLYKTVVGNWYQEMWYFIGVMIRAIHINVANPFLKMYMVGSIIERFRMEEAQADGAQALVLSKIAVLSETVVSCIHSRTPC